MKKILIQYAKQFCFWLGFFWIFKTLFLLANFSHTAALPASDIWGIYWHGLRMDLSAAAYLTVIPALLLCLYPWKQKLVEKILHIYTIIMLVALVLLGFADIGLYPEWETRIDAMALNFLKTPKGVWQCLLWWQWILALIGWIAVVYGFSWVHKKISTQAEDDTPARWWYIPVQLFLTACLILPIRGGVNTSPLNQSSVYFSKQLYANYSAYNYFWNFMYTVLNNEKLACPVNYMSEEDAKTALKGIPELSQEQVPLHLKELPNGQKPNVIIFLLESFSDRTSGAFGAKTDYTPRLTQLCKEGIIWPNFYATGNRSDKGFASVYAAYPALIRASSIMGFPDKLNGLDFLPMLFKNHGYDLAYYYAGDIEFYNKKILLVDAGVDKIYERTDFPAKIATMQYWGVPDEYLFQHMFEDFDNLKEPFWASTYNISTHPPFDIPAGNERIKGTDKSSLYCNSMLYSDSCIAHFIEQLKNSKYWDHTLVIITSDHTSPLPEPGVATDDPESYRIPMIWLGGMVEKPEVIDNICQQTDLMATLAQQLGWKIQPTYFSKNMFGSKQYAFYYRNELWGCVTPEAAFSYNMESGKTTVHKGEMTDSLSHFAEAWTQWLHLDFQKR